MKPSLKIKQILSKMTHSQLLTQSSKVGNKDLYISLSKSDDYAEISEKLNLHKEYSFYEKELDNAWDNFLNEKVTELISDYWHFLLEKICFPNGLSVEDENQKKNA